MQIKVIQRFYFLEMNPRKRFDTKLANHYLLNEKEKDLSVIVVNNAYQNSII